MDYGRISIPATPTKRNPITKVVGFFVFMTYYF